MSKSEAQASINYLYQTILNGDAIQWHYRLLELINALVNEMEDDPTT